MMEHNIRVKRLEQTGCGEVQAVLYEKDYKALCEALDGTCCPVPITISRYGVVLMLRWIRKRPGILIGMFLAAAWLIFSSLLVWRVDIVCLENPDTARESDFVDLSSVRGRLTEQGIVPGMLLPGFDTRHAEAAFLVGQEEVSWIAINRQGTVLSCEVRSSRRAERVMPGEPYPGEDGTIVGANLIANSDGIIVRTEVRNGVTLVLPEQMVTKGEILASGVFEARDGDVHFSRCSGKVFASTLRSFTETVPLIKEECIYSGETETRSHLRIMGLKIPLPTVRTAAENVTFLQTFRNLFGNTGFSLDDYDIIEDEKFLHLPGGIPLPVSVITEVRMGKTAATRNLSADEAMMIACEKLDACEDTLTDATVLSREERSDCTGDVLTVTRDVFCIDNIAEVSDFQIDHTGSETVRR